MLNGQLVQRKALESGVPGRLLAQLEAAFAVELDVHGGQAASDRAGFCC